MPEQEQNRRHGKISDEEYAREMQDVEKSDDPRVYPTDFSVIDSDTGKVSGRNIGVPPDEMMDAKKYTGAGTGTGAGISIGTANQGTGGTTEADMRKTLGDVDTSLASDPAQGPTHSRTEGESPVGDSHDQYSHPPIEKRDSN